MYLPPGLVGEIAKERQATILAAAAADRRAWRVRQAARQARKAARPARRGGGALAPQRAPVTLRDGSLVLIRPVHDSDAPLLAGGFGWPVTRRARTAGAGLPVAGARTYLSGGRRAGPRPAGVVIARAATARPAGRMVTARPWSMTTWPRTSTVSGQPVTSSPS
jgi:hypothetical protein